MATLRSSVAAGAGANGVRWMSRMAANKANNNTALLTLAATASARGQQLRKRQFHTSTAVTNKDFYKVRQLKSP
jgi:hypothetical protein